MKSTLPSKVITQNWRRESFPDKQKLEELIATKPAFNKKFKRTTLGEKGQD